MNAEIRSRSLILSVVIHGALFLLLLFFVMTTPIPPFPEAGGGGGVLVNIGYLDAASGEVQPMSSTVTPDPQQVKAVPQPAPEEKITTQEDEESVAMNTSEKKEKKETKKPLTETQKAEPVKTVDAGSLYKGKKNNSTSQGTSTGTGDQGDRQGDPDSKYTGKSGTGGGPGSGTGTGGGDGDGNGPGTGSGISFDLSGRKLLLKPSIDDRSQETGKVVVSITVDRSGNVTEARPGARGSTTTSSYLFAKAKEAALKAKFNASPEAADIQKGTMTFVFLVK